jgi:DeoR family transcriptional regulator of aga operon
VLVADASKIGRRAFAAVGEPGAFDTFITDDGITTKQLRDFEDGGMRVIVA